MEKNILILSDFVGFGNVALTSARTILSRMGHRVFCLPTALISNTWNHGSAAALDTTDFLRQSIAVWNSLGFSFDAVVIGYLASREQLQWVLEQCGIWKAQGAVIFMDPIFADNGRLYNGITPEQINLIRSAMTCADYLLPNLTEAQFLAGIDEPAEGCTAAETEAILTELQNRGANTVLITGVSVDGGHAVVLREGADTHFLPYDHVPGSFSGAGDTFSALFAGGCLSGLDAKSSIERAMAQTREWILCAVRDSWQGTGLPIERYFS